MITSLSVNGQAVTAWNKSCLVSAAMRIGFIGLGNAGGKLAGSLLRNDYDLTVRDLDPEVAHPFLDGGASWADSPREMAEACDVIILACRRQQLVRRSWRPTMGFWPG